MSTLGPKYLIYGYLDPLGMRPTIVRIMQGLGDASMITVRVKPCINGNASVSQARAEGCDRLPLNSH